MSLFSGILGRIERSWGWAHMQSVHACAVQTHFSLFAFFSQKRFHGESKIGQFGVTFHQKSYFCVKKGVPKTASKKGVPPISNEELFTGREAPGEAASRARCSDKKQLFEQQLKHYSKFWHKKVVWAQIWCKSLTGLLNPCKKNE